MTVTVSSGVSQSDLTISTGDPLVVLSGGTVEYSTVLDGGSATLSAGAVGNSLTVSAGGTLEGPGDLEGYSNVAGLVSGVTVADDGFLELASGGTAFDVAVTAPATAPYSYFEIDYGATASGASVVNGFVQDYGSAANTRIGSGGELDTFEGGRATDDVVESGGRLVLSGGKSTSATVESGGLLVLSGGEAVDDTVLSGGALGYGPYLTSDFTAGPVASTTVISGVTVSSGGVIDLYDAEVAQGATVSLTSGTVANDFFVDPGAVVRGAGAITGQSYVEGAMSGVSIQGQLELTSGGTASGVTVAADGSLQIDLGATDTGATALSGALVNVLGSARGVVVESKGEAYVNSGGVESGAVVEDGGQLLVYSGGVAARDTIQSGGTLMLDGGTVTGEAVLSGGTVDIQALQTADVTPGRVTSTTVLDGATLASGAEINIDGATIADGATVSVTAGTIVNNLDVDAGGVVTGRGVLAGFTEDSGRLSGVTIGDAAESTFSDLSVMSGGTLSGVTIGAQAQAFLDSGATATNTTILAGATFDVDGSATSAVIRGGGTLSLASGAAASALTVANGGLVLGPGELSGVNRIAGGLSGATLAPSGAIELVSGGTASGVTLAQTTGQATELEIDSGATAEGTEVASNAREVMRSGGVASGTSVLNGGLEYVLATGTASGTQVSAGGQEIVSSGGATRQTSVLSGGAEVVASGGAALDLSLLTGGKLVVNGELRVGVDETLAGTLSGSGAIVDVADLVLSGAGAAFTGKAALEGGTIELATSGALGTGPVQFVEPTTGSAVLQIDAADAPAAGGTFANTIVDFSGAKESVDLRSIAFVSGATARVTSSTLVLTDGGKTYAFKLAGATTASYSVTSDGHGGTLIDPKASLFTQAAAAFAPSDAAKTALVSSTASAAHTPFAHATASAGH